MSDTITVLAPAKLNLALAVGPPTEFGMHPICSWMVTVDLFDELTVTRLDDDRFSRYAILWHDEARRQSDIDWSVRDDLAVRAHLALENRVHRRLPVQMKLDKRIPVGGGLGGGSADAAAMLLAVNELFDLQLPREDLEDIGHALGSDIPFLMRGGSAIVEGMGDRIESHDPTPELHAVLAFPDAACHTGRVYNRYDEAGAARLRDDVVRALASMLPQLDPEALFNDLAGPALHLTPSLVEARSRFAALAERAAHLTGSGSSLFVICDDPLHAEALAGAVQQQLDLPAVAVRTTGGPRLTTSDALASDRRDRL